MTPDLVVGVSIEATPEEIFPYLVEPELLTRWLATWAEIDPQPGGSFAIDVRQNPVRGSYVAVEPPHRVVFTWGYPGNDSLPPGASTVEIRLRAQDNSTLVELTHRGLPPDRYDDHNRGWTELLSILAGVATG
jgi:uncharacterized protein YndB with AHSA1/START domain